MNRSSGFRLWQPFFLPAPVEDHLAFEEKADVAPLLDFLEESDKG